MPGTVVRGLPTFPALGYQLHARLQWTDCQQLRLQMSSESTVLIQTMSVFDTVGIADFLIAGFCDLQLIMLRKEISKSPNTEISNMFICKYF